VVGPFVLLLPLVLHITQALEAVLAGGIAQSAARLCLYSWINALAVQPSHVAPAADVVCAGCADGCIYICIWDSSIQYTTLSVAAVLSGHIAPICSLAWLDTTSTAVLLSGAWDETARYICICNDSYMHKSLRERSRTTGCTGGSEMQKIALFDSVYVCC
jgi:WD40 repeat protein